MFGRGQATFSRPRLAGKRCGRSPEPSVARPFRGPNRDLGQQLVARSQGRRGRLP